MKKDVYLSVDLDYWYNEKCTGDGLSFIKKLFSLDRPITIFTEHHLVLKDIKKQYNKVYNIDYHSDLSNVALGWPNCGTWVNYVYGRKCAEYEWRYPDYKSCIVHGLGLCHYDHEDESEFDPFYHKEFQTWKAISRAYGTDGINFESVDKISIVLSPSWSNAKTIHNTLMFLISDQSRQAKFFSKSVQKTIEKMLVSTE
jgi:hypothetical protein